MTNQTHSLHVPLISYCMQLLKLMRPFHWWKNGFVFVGIIFGHAWNNFSLVTAAFAAAVAFSLVSSSVYVVNDILDREADRHHPKKRKRPIAAGHVSVPVAWVLGALCWIIGCLVAWWVSPITLGIVLIYSLMNLAYSVSLKHVVIIDAFVISLGFILRVLAGTYGIGIPPSQWLLLCTIMLTLFLAFTKRRAELLVMAETHKTASEGRRVLSQYTPELLDNLISITAACTIICYSLYTTNSETLKVHHTNNLIFTVPVVTYGIFRYMYLLHRWKAGENPARELLGDPHMIATAVVYFGLAVWLIS